MAGMKEAHAIASPEHVVRHIAALTTAFAAGQMIGPLLAGALYELTHSFAPSLIATSLILIVTGWVLWRTRNPVQAPQDATRQPAKP